MKGQPLVGRNFGTCHGYPDDAVQNFVSGSRTAPHHPRLVRCYVKLNESAEFDLESRANLHIFQQTPKTAETPKMKK